MEELVGTLNGFIWSNWLIYLCLGAGLFYSILTRFAQVRLFGEMWRLLFTNRASAQGISSFQALAVSLAGRVGAGNIAGVAAAIGFGGPGAVFWMWVVAFLGASTSFAESTLAQIYKEEHEGEYRGGPAYYIEKCMGQKWYAWIFALATILACGFLLPTVQANAVGNAVALVLGSGDVVQTTALGNISSTKVIVAATLVLVLGFIFFGGMKRIARVAEIVVPFMAFAYIVVALVIIGLHIDQVPELLLSIVRDAFTPMAGMGAAIGWGVKRGVYSNEAGQGTGPHAAAAAEVEHPAQQGLVQALSVYIDTLFICTATALIILIAGTYNVHAVTEGAFIVQNISPDTVANSPAFTQMAVDSVFVGFGEPFVAIALFFFSFTTLLAYFFIAETNVAYIQRSIKIPGLMGLLKVGVLVAVFYGTVKTADVAWGLGDLGVGLMAWLNIIGILIIFFMAKPAMKALKDYEEQRKKDDGSISFDPKKLGIKNADFWEERQ
ncbi:MAG: alanine/glycine:cation symporter family protein [Pseudomonadota bacterium]